MKPVRRLFLTFFAVAFAAWLTPSAEACPFCAAQNGPTLTGDFQQAPLVLFGTLQNAAPGASGQGTTDMVVEEVLKGKELLTNTKLVTLPRYLPESKEKFLVFCDVFKGQVDPYRGISVGKESGMVAYLKGAFALEGKSPNERLTYFFKYLADPDTEVSLDAYREFGKADYKDYKDMAKKLPPDTIAAWLKNPSTPQYRFGLYASFLGHCGTAEHAKLLKEMITDPEKRRNESLDGLLAGYVMLAPKEGWQYMETTLKDPRQDFLIRYSILRTFRFFYDQRPDLIPQADIVKGMAEVMRQPDMSDFAIEDFRKWKQWSMTDEVLALRNRKGFDAPILKRAILRFALSSPDAKAAEFVRQERQRDAMYVEDVEELLKLDETPPMATPTATEKAK